MVVCDIRGVLLLHAVMFMHAYNPMEERVPDECMTSVNLMYTMI